MESKKDVCQRLFSVKSPIDYHSVVSWADDDRPRPPLEKWVKMEFPYQAPILPAPLPTVEDIKRAGEMGNVISHKNGLRPVFRVSAEYVVKFSPSPEILQVCLLPADLYIQD